MNNEAHQFKHPMGATATDSLTGFKGVITQRVQHITGCDSYLLTPKMKEGKWESSKWFDEGRIEVQIKVKQVQPEEVAGEKNGCEHNETERG